LFYNCRSHHLHLDTKQQNSQPQRQSATDWCWTIVPQTTQGT
jgi:hypothetical protein